MFGFAIFIYVLFLLLACLFAYAIVPNAQYELGLIFVVISFVVDRAMYYAKMIATKEIGDFTNDSEIQLIILLVCFSTFLFCVGFTITANSTYNPVYSYFCKTMIAVLIVPKIISSVWSIKANGDL